MDGPWILGLFFFALFLGGGVGLRSTLLWIRVIVDRDLLYTLKFKLHIQVVPSPSFLGYGWNSLKLSN